MKEKRRGYLRVSLFATVAILTCTLTLYVAYTIRKNIVRVDNVITKEMAMFCIAIVICAIFLLIAIECLKELLIKAPKMIKRDKEEAKKMAEARQKLKEVAKTLIRDAVADEQEEIEECLKIIKKSEQKEADKKTYGFEVEDLDEE